MLMSIMSGIVVEVGCKNGNRRYTYLPQMHHRVKERERERETVGKRGERVRVGERDSGKERGESESGRERQWEREGRE